MAVNSLNFEQVATVLTSIVKQATNQAVLTPTDTASFVSVAQIALRADRDAVMNAIIAGVGREVKSDEGTEVDLGLEELNVKKKRT